MTAETAVSGMPSAPPAVARLYAAFSADDPSALLAALTPDFRGVVADGMPLGLGGTYQGADAMLTLVWGAQNRLSQGGDEVPVRLLLAESIAQHVLDENLIAGAYRGHDEVIGHSIVCGTTGAVTELGDEGSAIMIDSTSRS